MEEDRPEADAGLPPEAGQGGDPGYELLPVEVPRLGFRSPAARRASRAARRPRFRFTIAGLMILIAALAPALAHPRAFIELTGLAGFVATITVGPLLLALLAIRSLKVVRDAALLLAEGVVDAIVSALGRLYALVVWGRAPGGRSSSRSAPRGDGPGTDPAR